MSRNPWPDPVRLNRSISTHSDQRVDCHLIGSHLFTRDLCGQLDLHALTPAELDAHILAGDDFVQWSLRFRLIVFDDGQLRRAAPHPTAPRAPAAGRTRSRWAEQRPPST